MNTDSSNRSLALRPDAVLSTAQDWADHINGEWRKTVEGIIATGEALLSAKESLEHGSFQRLFNGVDRPVAFGGRTAQMLMSVAERFSNPKYTSHLPPSWMTLYELTKVGPDVVDQWIEAGTVHPELQQKEAQRLIRSLKEAVPSTTASPRAEAFDTKIGKAVFKAGDFRERLLELEPGSVDLILTDPPYPKEDLGRWSDLAQVAARLLTKRGLLMAYTGQIFLPQVLSMLDEHLAYGWTFSLMLPGSGSRIMGRHIIQGWKPIVAYSLGTWPSGEWADDVILSPERDKTLYEWQQHALPAQRLIERFSPPNGLVVDPFLGVGSFAVAAQILDRRFVGVEKDSERFNVAVTRLQSV